LDSLRSPLSAASLVGKWSSLSKIHAETARLALTPSFGECNLKHSEKRVPIHYLLREFE